MRSSRAIRTVFPTLILEPGVFAATTGACTIRSKGVRKCNNLPEYATARHFTDGGRAI